MTRFVPSRDRDRTHDPLRVQQAPALAEWEADGGRVVADDAERWPPPLPVGYHARPIREFSDRTGCIRYEFNRVYGPPHRLGMRAPVAHMDEDLSYWSVTWPAARTPSDTRRVGRWTTYAEARKLRGASMTLYAYHALSHEEVASLLRVSAR